jgi:phosphate uptake regulator
VFRLGPVGVNPVMASQLSRDSSLDFVADALERLLHASPGDADGILRWLYASSGVLHKDAVDVLANVGHFVADVDIRDRDQMYRTMQERAMRELILALRQGEAREQLMMFSFLE